MAVNRFHSRLMALRGFLYRRLGIAISGDEGADEILAPSITAGTAAPTATTEAEGSLYIRVSSTVGVYQYRSSAWVLIAGIGSDLGTSVKVDAIIESTASADVTIVHPRFGTATTLTIASGAVAATQVHHQLDTEGAAASDDLDSITGGANGDFLRLRLAAAARNVVIKHAIGANLIACPGGGDITLDVLTDWVELAWNGTQWTVIAGSMLAGVVDTVPLYDPADSTKRARIDVGEVTAGQTRVLTVPDQNVDADQFIRKATGTISAAALRTLNATPVSMIAAPGATKYIKVLWVHWFLDYGGVTMDAAAAGDTLNAKYTDGSGAAVVDAVAGDAIGAAAADYHTTVLGVPEVIPVANAAIVAHIAAGEWYAAAGTSELKFVAYYQVCTLPT